MIPFTQHSQKDSITETEKKVEFARGQGGGREDVPMKGYRGRNELPGADGTIQNLDCRVALCVCKKKKEQNFTHTSKN